MKSQEFITEFRGAVMNILRRELPDWPDYVIKDWIGARIKSPQDLENKIDYVREVAEMVHPNSWKLVQKMPLTLNMLDDSTKTRMKMRKFGDANPFKVPKDRERLEQSMDLVKSKGMENLPPIIMLQHANGLELVEGWHRIMAAFRLHPEGFRINAWIGVAT